MSDLPRGFFGPHVPKGYTRGATYPLCDTPTREETGGAPFAERVALSCAGVNSRFRAIPTGEKRAPKKGEWYLSGAVVEGYRAANDLTTEYHIAKLVRVERTVTETYRVLP